LVASEFWSGALHGAPDFCARQMASGQLANKKQGATGITTVAPYIAGQWGRGE
jgi:hypothetical protein